MDFRHVYHTANYLKMVRYKDSLIGKRYRDVDTAGTGRTAEYAQKLRAISNYVNKTGCRARYVTSNIIENDITSCYMIEESIIINPENSEKTGRLVKIELLDVSLMWQILQTTNNFKRNRKSTTGIDHVPPLQITNPIIKAETPWITEREREILFLMIIGEKYKSIASILSNVYGKDTKKSTVKSIVHNYLFEKFKVFNNEMLIEKVIQNNTITEIPAQLLKLLDGILNVQLIPAEFEKKSIP